MKLFSWAAAILLLFCTGTLDAYALGRVHIADATLVDRAELIVVAHIESTSISMVSHGKDQAGTNMGWHHVANLVIAQTLKGKISESKIPIYIEYGLTLIVGDVWKNAETGSTYGSPNAGRGLPKDRIEIVDTGNSGQPTTPTVNDAREDNIWFLHNGYSDSLGIHDPEDLQPLRLREYFQCYFASDPESSVRTFLWQNPEVAKRAQEYLDHCEVTRLLAIDDPLLRAQRLLPFYLMGTKTKARDGIVACGPVAGSLLLTEYLTNSRNQRWEIINMWGDMGFKQSIPILTDLLTEDNKYWNSVHLDPDWWNSDKYASSRNLLREKYSDDYHAVCALHVFQDPNTTEILEQTKATWERMNFENKQIVEKCDEALRDLRKSASS